MIEKSVIPADEDIVLVKDYIEDIAVELKYSTCDNFTGKVIYDYKNAYLRYGTIKKLKKVQNSLKEKGYRLKIWDAFRTIEAQFVLWEVYPVDEFVADPNKGGSSHNCGNTVDVTVIDENGNELEMPTAFDDFQAMIDYQYDLEENKVKSENARMLKAIMLECGFYHSPYEWWHFRDVDKYPIERNFVHSELNSEK